MSCARVQISKITQSTNRTFFIEQATQLIHNQDQTRTVRGLAVCASDDFSISKKDNAESQHEKAGAGVAHFSICALFVVTLVRHDAGLAPVHKRRRRSHASTWLKRSGVYP